MPSNLVIIHCDQMRAFDVGCYGHPMVRTPNIDRLAAGGVRFETAVSNDPVCSPARAALLAGQHPRTCVGAIGNVGIEGAVPQRTRFPSPTLPECLKQVGYHTELIGKWHTWDHPNRCGFDHSVHPLPPHVHYGQRYFEDEDTEGFVVERFAPHDELDRVKDFLSQRAAGSDQPFFLHYNPGPPHMPLGPGHAPEHYLNMYDPDDVPLRPNVFDDEGNPAHDERWFKIYTIWDYFIRHFAGESDRPTDRAPEGMTLRHLTAWYLGMVTLIDDLVGEVMAALDAQNLRDNTIVVFTSDHGDNLGSHGRFNKGRLIEESIRVPLVFHAPGRWVPRLVTGQVAQTIDLMPTLLHALGASVPDEVQGRDLSPVMRGEAERLADDAGVIESPQQGAGIRTPRYTLGVAHASVEADRRVLADEPNLLYDNAADPLQQRNLVDDPAHAAVRGELHERVKTWDRDTPWWS